MRRKIFPAVVWKMVLPVPLLFNTPLAKCQSTDPDKAPGSVGMVTFTYQDKRVTLKTVRAKDGNIWLQQNLGSQGVASTPTDALAYGDLFQWGRWDDAHQTREPVYSSRRKAEPNNPAGLKLTGKNPYLYDGLSLWWLDGTSDDRWSAASPSEASATNGCDPCRAIGTGWRLPTIEEWETVIEAEEITDGSSNMYSNLRLSYAGEREYNGVGLTNVRKAGIYWSSTASNREGGARVVRVYAEGITGKNVYYRAVGASVRCIKKSVSANTDHQ